MNHLPTHGGYRLKPGVARARRRRYSAPVTVNPVAGFGDPNYRMAQQRPHTIAGAFFVPAVSCYGGCAWETFGSAGFHSGRFANLRTAASNDCLATVGGSSTPNGAPPMRHIPARSPSTASTRAAAHRAMALAALHADSSLAVRQRRYAEHMACAAELEGSTRDPRTALAWIKAGKSVHIDALNLPDQLRHVRALAALEAEVLAKLIDTGSGIAIEHKRRSTKRED